MGLQINREEGYDSLNVFENVLEVVPGGITLDSTELVADKWLDEGAFVEFDRSTRMGHVVKTVKLQAAAGSSDTTYKVLKGHHFKVGDVLAAVVGGAAYAITDIDESNADYDILTVGTTLGEALTAGDVLFEAASSGASGADYKYTANGILKNGCKAGDNTGVSVVVRGTVNEGVLPYGVTAEIKTALTDRLMF